MRFAKLNKNNITYMPDFYNRLSEEVRIKVAERNGFLPFEESQKPDSGGYRLTYAVQDGVIKQKWVEVVSVSTLKSERIAESKTALAAYLESHPLTWADGKQYSVTAEKQSLLNNALAVYQLAIAAGQPAELSWNATGEECTHWEYDALCALALAIAEYVKPLVSKQQSVEVAINAARTADEVNDVEISYS